MTYYTSAKMRSYAGQRVVLASLFKAAGGVSVFLSHSHQDKTEVEGLKVLLSQLQVGLYIDWLEVDMQGRTSADTAAKLQENIRSHQKFMVFATANALKSVWVPWELGFADTVKGQANILIWPVIDAYPEWRGNEYLGIYAHVEDSPTGPQVVLPSGHSDCDLMRWFRR